MVLLLKAVREVFLIAVFASRLYPLEAGGTRFRGVLVRVELIAAIDIVI